MQRGVTAGLAAAVCSTIKGRDTGIRALPGTRIANPDTGEVIYSPPEGLDVIIEKIGQWERFIHADDGNGRTGRILNVLMLVEAGLLRLPVLYLSRYIIDTKGDYYRLLLAVTAKSAWEPWVLYMLAGIEQTSLQTLAKIAAIRELQDDFSCRARSVTRGGADAEFQSVLFEQPYCRIATVMDRCGVSRPTATSWLNALADHGLLQPVKAGRDRLFINSEFLQLLVRPEPIGEARRS